MRARPDRPARARAWTDAAVESRAIRRHRFHQLPVVDPWNCFVWSSPPNRRRLRDLARRRNSDRIRNIAGNRARGRVAAARIRSVPITIVIDSRHKILSAPGRLLSAEGRSERAGSRYLRAACRGVCRPRYCSRARR